MNERGRLTLIWVSAFLLGLLLLESHVHVHRNGIRLLTPGDRPIVMKPLIAFYGAYLGAIFASWYAKRFPPVANEEQERVRFLIAASSTIFLNVVVLVLASKALVEGGPQNVLDNVTTAIHLGGWLSVLVAPANIYYFGIKPNIGKGLQGA